MFINTVFSRTYLVTITVYLKNTVEIHGSNFFKIKNKFFFHFLYILFAIYFSFNLFKILYQRTFHKSVKCQLTDLAFFIFMSIQIFLKNYSWCKFLINLFIGKLVICRLKLFNMNSILFFKNNKKNDCQRVLTLAVIVPQPLFFKTLFRWR